MKIKYLRLKNWFLVSLMSLLGLSACKSTKDMPKEEKGRDYRHPRKEIMLMYGVPTTDFIQTEPQVQPDTIDAKKELSLADTIPSAKPRKEVVAMYGVPTVDYKVSGRVVDSQGRPVKGAHVLLLNTNIDADTEHLPSSEYWDAEVQRVSDTTDAQGNFTVKTTDNPWQQPRILVRDIDGKANGSFKNEEFPIDYSDAKTNNASKGWYQGEREKSDVVIQVKEN